MLSEGVSVTVERGLLPKGAKNGATLTFDAEGRLSGDPQSAAAPTQIKAVGRTPLLTKAENQRF